MLPCSILQFSQNIHPKIMTSSLILLPHVPYFFLNTKFNIAVAKTAVNFIVHLTEQTEFKLAGDISSNIFTTPGGRLCFTVSHSRLCKHMFLVSSQVSGWLWENIPVYPWQSSNSTWFPFVSQGITEKYYIFCCQFLWLMWKTEADFQSVSTDVSSMTVPLFGLKSATY